MPPKFGTSGLRGLVVELTDDLIASHVRAFLATCCEPGTPLWIGQDLRQSSPRIAATVARTARAAGHDTVDCGALPTPALALAAQNARAAALMVTGSHIPADRNGLKFYTTAGEITKDDERAITAALAAPPVPQRREGTARTHAIAIAAYVARYLTAFGAGALGGRRIGLYSHSAVGRDALAEVLRGLGAEVRDLGRADRFVPVDTEAVDPATRARLADWAAAGDLFAIVSTDGDSDRPLLTDATGRIVPGDLLGQIAARELDARTVVTPVSSNSGVDAMGFADVRRTRIGSPFVIAAMADAPRALGYEANGGTLLGFDAAGPAGPLAALATRDAFLPLLTCLAAAARTGSVAACVAALPPRFTASDRLEEVDTARGAALVAALTADAGARARFLAFAAAPETGIDLTDGLRMTLASGATVHLRPSGNAPEMRLYAEAGTPEDAADLLARGLVALRAALDA